MGTASNLPGRVLTGERRIIIGHWRHLSITYLVLPGGFLSFFLLQDSDGHSGFLFFPGL